MIRKQKETQFRIFQRYYDEYFNMFFDLSNDSGNMGNMNLYSESKLFDVLTFHMIYDGNLKAFVAFVTTVESQESQRRGVLTLN